MKVFWSVIPLANTGHSASDFYTAHTTVMGLFPPISERARSEANILFRLEREFSRILVQSAIPPSLDQIELLGGGSRVVDLDALAAHRALHYRIDIYSVSRYGNVERSLNHDGASEHWKRLAERSGLELAGSPADALLECTDRVSRKSGSNRPKRLRVSSFSGIAEVVESDLLTQALFSGVGRAKSFGCGLLTTAPV